jgi:hypothetical protein
VEHRARTPPALAITLSSLVAPAIGVLVQGFGVQDASPRRLRASVRHGRRNR